MIFENFKALESELDKFYQPILDVENSISIYIDSKLKTAIALKESLDISRSISDTLNQYSTLAIRKALGQVYIQIDVAFGGFYELLEELQDDILGK